MCLITTIVGWIPCTQVIAGGRQRKAWVITMDDFKWSKTEKKISRSAFDKAYERECADIVKNLNAKVKKIKSPKELWRVHDFLTDKREDIDEKYDYRYSKLILVFARLTKDGWLDYKDLQGLAENKIGRIESLTTFWNE